MSDPVDPSQGVKVEVRGLRKSFGKDAVLQGIDFSVEAGEIFVIMGPSGSGKTVLLKHIIGLEKPDAGEILIEGQPVHENDIMARYRLAMVFQSGGLLHSLNVRDNVGIYLDEHQTASRKEVDRIVREKLELVGLADEKFEEKFPAELSGGEKKRVAIARALVVEPQLILYDEPTSELDPLMAVVIAQEIRAFNRQTGVTSIVVSHDRDLAFGVANRIALIHEGRIISIGTPDEIRNDSNPVVQKFITADFNKEPQFI